MSVCRSCNSPDRELMLSLGPQPAANSYLKKDQLDRMEPFYPMDVFVCRRCMLVQLDQVIRPEEIFSDYAYFSSYSETWLDHARRYVDMISGKLGLGPHSRVIELASNDGYLLQNFVRKGIPVLGVEPAANVAKVAREKGIETEVAFFGTEFAEGLVRRGTTADLIIGNNVLAHVPGLNDFVQGMKLALKPDGVITMEFPHLMNLINGNLYDTIYHEHFSYFSLIAVEKVFASHGLRVFDVEEIPTHGGSLRIYCAHQENASRPESENVKLLRGREIAAGYGGLALYRRFAGKVKASKRRALEFLIKAKDDGKKIAGYGAPAKGNTFLNYCGIRTDFIDFTVDRNPHKQGLYLPGTHIPIESPNAILEFKPAYVLILPWNLKHEIVDQMKHIRQWGGKFLVFQPDLEVL